jgi:hypothetical protein
MQTHEICCAYNKRSSSQISHSTKHVQEAIHTRIKKKVKLEAEELHALPEVHRAC